jgi:cytochrome c oxidase accessory protein FixG
MSANAAGGAPVMYAAHQKVYPREISGRFATLRWLAVFALLGLFYGLPWVQWDGRQAVLFDLPQRKFFIFSLTFFPQDFYLLTWLLIIAALTLFFVTALGGRLWCGYACPQTVWTQVFVWLERVAEGTWAHRIKLDKGRMTPGKFGRKVLKQVLWISFALFTGFAFVGFFVPVRSLGPSLLDGGVGFWAWFWILFYGFATYGNAGFMREQVCKYMCPYARFQSAMFDRDTLLISYDKARNDCIDCTICVQVCPTGIDIRNGLQYECIACAACIDACDPVMDKVGRPRGLIRYSTQNEIDGRRSRLLRPRVILYGALLSLLIVGFAVAVSLRVPVTVDVLRDRNTLYRELPDGGVENVYSIRIINKDQHAHDFRVTTAGLAAASVDSDMTLHPVPAEAVRTVVVRVRVPPGHVHGGQDFQVLVQAADAPGIVVRSRARFFAD